MKISLTFTVDVADEVASRINDDNDDFDAVDVASTVTYSITSPYITGATQEAEYEVV